MLLWDVRRYLYPGRLGAGRVVVQFEFPMMPPGGASTGSSTTATKWMCASPILGWASTSKSRPTFALSTAVWMGDQPFEEAPRQGLIEVSGPRRYSSEVPGWFGQHPVLSKVASKRHDTE